MFTEVVRHHSLVKFRKKFEIACRTELDINPPKDILANWYFELISRFSSTISSDDISEELGVGESSDQHQAHLLCRFEKEEFGYETCKELLYNLPSRLVIKNSNSEEEATTDLLVNCATQISFMIKQLGRETVDEEYQEFVKSVLVDNDIQTALKILEPFRCRGASQLSALSKTLSTFKFQLSSAYYLYGIAQVCLELELDYCLFLQKYEFVKQEKSSKGTLEVVPHDLPNYTCLNYERNRFYSCITIKNDIIEKLRKLYRGDNFQRDLFIIALRYNNDGPFSDDGNQASLPPKLWRVINENFTNVVECMASPINSTCVTYYSAFPDIDIFFGSKGSFFESSFQQGWYEVNPPFIQAIIELVALKISRDLETSKDQLGFILVIPTWCTVENTNFAKFIKRKLYVTSEHYYDTKHVGIYMERSTIAEKDTTLFKSPSSSCLTILTSDIDQRILSAWSTTL